LCDRATQKRWQTRRYVAEELEAKKTAIEVFKVKKAQQPSQKALGQGSQSKGENTTTKGFVCSLTQEIALCPVPLR